MLLQPKELIYLRRLWLFSGGHLNLFVLWWRGGSSSWRKPLKTSFLCLCLRQDGSLERLSSAEFVCLSRAVESFARDTEELCGRRSVSLRGALQSQANRFVHRFHEERKTKLRCAAGRTRTCKAWCSCCNASTCCHMMQMLHSSTTWTVGHYGHLHLNFANLRILIST